MDGANFASMTHLFRFLRCSLLVCVGLSPWMGGCVAQARKTADGQTVTKTDSKNVPIEEQAPLEAAPWNEAIIAAVEKVPLGGGYATTLVARDAMQAAVAWEDGKPALRPAKAQPSFCSGATYLTFVVALAQAQRAGAVHLTPETWRALIVEGQADGEGVWGRWNANGPGTARLFYETGAGTNFTDIQKAKPGDFLKIFWNDNIGASEKGHSVIFAATGQENGEETVSFWSSNSPGGYGNKTVPRSKIKRMIFSRLEHPERLEEVSKLPPRDAFLASLEEKTVSALDAAKAVGLSRL
jgi:hypothetical protein